MAQVHYTATVREERLLELPEEARELHLTPGQEIDIQIDQSTPREEDPALALFAQWEREDAARSPQQSTAEDQLWQEFEKDINAARQAQGMRPL